MGKITILLVDNEYPIRQLLATCLSNEGYHTIEASSGNEAIAALRDIHVDLVVSDFQMEDGDGLLLLSEVRKTKPSLPVIIITADASLSEEDVLRRGAKAYLQKPFHLAELIAQVRSALH